MMEVDTEDHGLRSKIARLSGRIQRQKLAQQAGLNHNHAESWRAQRGTPYGGHFSGGASTPPHRHKVLVIDTQGNHESLDDDSDMEEGEIPQWIRKDDRHLQLINTSVFDKQTLQRTLAIEKTKRKKIQHRTNQEKGMLARHIQTGGQGHRQTRKHAAAEGEKYLVVNSIRFLVTEGGSRLIKTDGRSDRTYSGLKILTYREDEPNKYYVTPKRANVGGVIFHRSKTGNLYRGGLVQLHRSACTTIQEVYRLIAMTVNKKASRRATNYACTSQLPVTHRLLSHSISHRDRSSD